MVSENITVMAGPVIDVSSPVSIMSPATSAAPYYTNVSSVLVKGDLTDIVPLTSGNWTYYVNGTEVAHGAFAHISGLGSFAVDTTYPLQLGNNTVVMMFNDSAGNSVMCSLTTVYDLTPPSVNIVSPANDTYNNTGGVTVTWTGGDVISGIAYYNMSIDGNTPIELPASTTSYTFSDLTDGSYTVVVEAVDNAGNMNETSVSFIVSFGPTIKMTPGDGSTTVHERG